ncbi:MAG TPA: hypothetical protein VHT30_08980 [Acidimicrobiales bacterium]|nr:hypothetical protein [Acidimicrobiales bacterium]
MFGIALAILGREFEGDARSRARPLWGGAVAWARRSGRRPAGC